MEYRVHATTAGVKPMVESSGGSTGKGLDTKYKVLRTGPVVTSWHEMIRYGLLE